MKLPVATEGACRSGKALSRQGIFLYAACTLGGALGLVLVAGWTLRLWGITGSMLLLGGINVIAAVLFFWLDHGWTVHSPHSTSPPVPAMGGEILENRAALSLSFFSGAGVMALEVLGLQLLNLKTPVAFYPQTAVLFSTVFLLALAAAIVPTMVNRCRDSRSALEFSLAGPGLAIAASPVLFMAYTRNTTGLLGNGGGFGAFLVNLGLTGLVALGPAVLLGGLVFPLLIATAQCASGLSAGRHLGTLLAVNGVGGLLGAEIAYRVLLPLFGVHVALGTVGAGYVFTSLALWLTSTRRTVLAFALCITSLGATGLLLATSLKSLPVFLRASTFNVVEIRSGREGSLAVVERGDLGRALYLDNHYMLGCTKAAPDMQRQAHLPLLLHPEPKRVCFVGLGTGLTASASLQHQCVESVTIYELSRFVADAAARHFAAYNQDVCSNPKVTLRIQDAGPQLAADREAFDVIVGDLFTPWRPGEARLCSLEQFEATRQSLRPGDVFCQWLPMTQFTQQHFDLIAATFQQVFGEVYLFRNHFRNSSLPVALVGFKGRRLDWDIIARRCEAERKAGALRDPVCRHPEGLALLYLGTYAKNRTLPDGRLNTLENLRVELAASHRLLAGGPEEYFSSTGDSWAAVVQQQLERIKADEQFPGPLRSLPGVGTLLSHWGITCEAEEATARVLEREIPGKLPDALQSDSDADWSLWPGHSRKSWNTQWNQH